MRYTRRKKGGNKSEITKILDEVIKSNEYYVKIAKDFNAEVNEINLKQIMEINTQDIRNLPNPMDVIQRSPMTQSITQTNSIFSSGEKIFHDFANVNVDETYNTIYEEFQYGKTIYNQLIEKHLNKESNEFMLTMHNLHKLFTDVNSYTTSRKTKKWLFRNSKIATDTIQINSPSPLFTLRNSLRNSLRNLSRKNSVAPSNGNNIQYNISTSEITYNNYIIRENQIQKDNTVVTYDEQKSSMRIEIDKSYTVEISIISDKSDKIIVIPFSYKNNKQPYGIKRIKDRMYVGNILGHNNFKGVMWVEEYKKFTYYEISTIIKVNFNIRDTDDITYDITDIDIDDIIDTGIMVHKKVYTKLNKDYTSILNFNEMSSFVYYGNFIISGRINYNRIHTHDYYILICNRFGSYQSGNNNKLIMYNNKKNASNTFIKIDKKLIYLRNSIDLKNGYHIPVIGSYYCQYENGQIVCIKSGQSDYSYKKFEDSDEDSDNYKTTIQYYNSKYSKYTGQISSNNVFIQLNNGKMTYINGDVYVGYWKNNEREGQGKMTYKNGDVYVGYWKNNERKSEYYPEYYPQWARYVEFQGKMTYKNGDVYEGDWKNDEREGEGKMTFKNGDVYEGDWKNDLRVGKGKMRYTNGDVYVGELKNDLRVGKGKMTYKNGDVYEGEWTNDQREGKGKMTYKNGDVYDGIWKNDSYMDNVDIPVWSNQHPNKITKKLLNETEVRDIFTWETQSVYEHLQQDKIVFHIYGTDLFYVISTEILKRYCKNKKFIIHTCNKDGTINKNVKYLCLEPITLYQLLPISNLNTIIDSKSKEYQFIILTKTTPRFESTISKNKIESGNCEKSSSKEIIYSMHRLNWENLPE